MQLDTPQMIFDASVTHMLRQGRPAVVWKDAYPICQYRTADGLACAVGCLIPDEQYSPEFEGASVGQDIFQGELLSWNKFLDLLRALQNCHDNRGDFSTLSSEPSPQSNWITDKSGFPIAWDLPHFLANLRYIAHLFNLSPAVLSAPISAPTMYNSAPQGKGSTPLPVQKELLPA